jgi:hypothetical protein
MEIEVIHTVLTEVLAELREIKQQQGNDAKAIYNLKEKVEHVELKFYEAEIVRSAKQTAAISSTVGKELQKIKEIITAQPKSTRKEFRILLFPEYNAAEYYRIVFGRLLFWMVICLIATYFFVLGREYIEANAMSRERLMEKFHYRKAWNYVYQNGTKSMKKKMDTAWGRNIIPN